MNAERKPGAKIELPPDAQKRRPRTVHFNDFEWNAILDAARRKFLAPSVFIRIAALRAVKNLRTQAEEEASWEMQGGWR